MIRLVSNEHAKEDSSNQPSYRSLLALPNYRLLLLSQIVSAIGDGVYAIALIWLMKTLTGSALLMSILLAAETVPLLLFGLFAGVIVDRGSKKKIMMLCDIARGSIVALLVLLWVNGWLLPYMLIIAAVLLSSFSAFFGPSRVVAIRTLVPEDHMVQAQSLAQLVQTVVGLSAPAIGAWLLYFGTSYAFIFNAATFFASFLFIWLIRNERLTETRVTTLNRRSFVVDFKEGIVAVTSHALLRSLIQYIVLINFMLAPTTLLFPLIVDDSSELALLQIAFFVGITAGVFLIGLVKKWRRIAALATGIGLMLVGLGLLTWVHGLYAGLLCVFVAGLGSPLANVTLQTLFVLKVPKEVLGRASSLMKVLLESSRPLAMLLTGALLAWIPVRLFFGIMGLFGVLLVVTMVLNRSIRKEQDEPKPGRIIGDNSAVKEVQ